MNIRVGPLQIVHLQVLVKALQHWRKMIQ